MKKQKLTIKALKELLNKSFMIKNYIGVLKDGNAFYVVYRDRVVTYRYSPACGWCFCMSGYTFYSDTKSLLKIVDTLDDDFIGDTTNDND